MQASSMKSLKLAGTAMIAYMVVDFVFTLKREVDEHRAALKAEGAASANRTMGPMPTRTPGKPTVLRRKS